MEYKRSEIIDSMKTLSTILVVYIHSHNVISFANITSENIIIRFCSALASAAVPSFFLTSAYLTAKSKKSYNDNVKKKMKVLLLPYLMWVMIYVMLESAGNRVLPTVFLDVTGCGRTDWIKNIIGIHFYTSPIYTHLWFVRDLFILNLIEPILKRMMNSITIHWMILIIGGYGTHHFLDISGRQSISLC